MSQSILRKEKAMFQRIICRMWKHGLPRMITAVLLLYAAALLTGSNVNAATAPAAPTGLKQTAAAETSITMEWKAVSGVDGYKIAYRAGTSGTWTVSETTATKKTISNRKKNTSYQVRVCSKKNGAFGSYSSIVNAVTISKVTGLKQTTGSSSAAYFEYNAVSGATAYKCALSTSKNGKYTEFKDITDTEYYAYNVPAGSSVYVKVKAKRGSVYGEYCSPVEMVTAPDDYPTVYQTGATETSVTLTMSGVTGATGCSAEYSPYSYYTTFYSRSDRKTVNGNGSTVTISGLARDTSYEVKVKSFRKSSAGFIAYGPVMFMIRRVYVLPGKGRITELKNNGHNEFKITWENSGITEGTDIILYDSAGNAVQTIPDAIGEDETADYKSCGNYTVKVRSYILTEGNNLKLYGAYSDPKTISSPYPNHSWKETASANPATCTTAGVRTYKCEYCSAVKNENAPAFGHSWSGWYRKDRNYHARTCSHNASHVETQPHTWNSGKVITAATKTSTGTIKYTCTACYATRTEVIPKLGSGTITATQQENKIAKLKTDEDPGGAVFGKLKLNAVKVTNSSIALKWTKVKGASGYIVYGNKCGSKYKKLKIIKKAKTVAWTQKKLKKGTYYKYLVVAVKKSGGATVVAATSKSIHIATSGGKKGNYKSVKLKNVKKNKLTLAKGKTFQIKAAGVPANKKQKVSVHRKLKYESSAKKIASVSSTGKIKAVKKGSANIYVYAQNGVYQTIRVTVK